MASGHDVELQALAGAPTSVNFFDDVQLHRNLPRARFLHVPTPVRSQKEATAHIFLWEVCLVIENRRDGQFAHKESRRLTTTTEKAEVK